MLQRLKKWWWKADKNRFVQEICAVLLGIGLGLYGYESKVALVPMKWNLDSRVARSMQQQSQQPLQSPQFAQLPSPQLAQWFPKLPEIKRFWQQPWAERYREHLSRYTQLMENLGVRGGLQQRVQELMEQGVEPFPRRWTAKENRPFVLAGLLVVVAAFLTKLLLYLSILNFNKRPAKAGKKPVKPARHAKDWNGMAQDVGTIGLTAMGGLYLQPALEEFLKGEAPSYPYPLTGVLIFLGFLLLKLALSSSLLDINAKMRKAGPLLSFRRFSQFSRTYDWNDLGHEVTALILGIGLGFYAYESNLALLPLKWKSDRQVASEIARESRPQEDSKGITPFLRFFKENPVVKQRLGDFWKQTGVDRYVDQLDRYTRVYEHMGFRGRFREKLDRFMRGGVEPIPQRWKAKENLPYLIGGLVLVLLSFLVKLLLYLQMLDLNRLLQWKKSASARTVKKYIDWNEMVQGFSTVALSVLAGMYTNPCMEWLAGEEAISYPYPRVGPLLILLCIALKFLLYCGIVNLNRKQPTPVAKKPAARRPGPRRR